MRASSARNLPLPGEIGEFISAQRSLRELTQIPFPLGDFSPGGNKSLLLSEEYRQATTLFTSFLGTRMIFLIVFPAMNGCTFSDASAVASMAAVAVLAGTRITPRSLLFTCTGISSVSGTTSELEEWSGGRAVAEVEQNLVPETRG